MKIRVIEANGPKGHAIEHDTLRLYEGDEITVGDELGALLCRAGLAKDLAGRVPTGDRPKGITTHVVPESARHAHRAEEG